MVKNIPAVQEMWAQSLGSGRSLGEGTPSTPVILPGKSHGQRKKPGGLLPLGSQRVRHDWSDLACTHSLSVSIVSVLSLSLSKNSDHTNSIPYVETQHSHHLLATIQIKVNALQSFLKSFWTSLCRSLTPQRSLCLNDWLLFRCFWYVKCH